MKSIRLFLLPFTLAIATFAAQAQWRPPPVYIQPAPPVYIAPAPPPVVIVQPTLPRHCIHMEPIGPFRCDMFGVCWREMVPVNHCQRFRY